MVVYYFPGEASIPLLLSQVDYPLAKVVYVVVVGSGNNAALLDCIDGSRRADMPLCIHTASTL